MELYQDPISLIGRFAIVSSSNNKLSPNLALDFDAILAIFDENKLLDKPIAPVFELARKCSLQAEPLTVMVSSRKDRKNNG